MKDLLDKIFPTLSDELIIVISLIIGLLVTASLILFLVKKIFPKTNISELAARTRSWWIMAGMFIGAVFISYNISYFFLAFLSFIAFRELYSVLGFREADRGALFWGILAIPIQYYLAYLAWYGAFIIFIPVVMFLVLPLRLVLKGDTHGITKSMALLQWILMLSVFGISHLAYLLSLPELPGFSSGGRGLLLFLVFLTEINDVMQFIWGKLLGRHKILPKISPNKTWEGFLGGVISTTVIGYFLGFLTPLSAPNVILVSALIAIAGFSGDVVISAIKRDKGIKDMGNSIPGHGGVFDRIDSLAYTAPVFFHLVYYIAYLEEKMEKRFMQSVAMRIIYKGVFHWFLKLIVGVQFTDCQFLKKEKQFIILANHNSHLDTLSLLSSLPGNLLWKVKPVAAEDYFGKTRFQASISNFFINTLLIRRKGEKDSEHDPIRKMLEAIDAGYSLILFPEGTRGKSEQMGKIKSGIARILSLRPEVKYIPVFMTGMGRSLPKGKMILLPYKASVYYGIPTLVKSTDTHEILDQITGDFEVMKEKYQVVIDEEEE